MDIQTNPMAVTSDVLSFAFPELAEPAIDLEAGETPSEPEVMSDETTGTILDVSA